MRGNGRKSVSLKELGGNCSSVAAYGGGSNGGNSNSAGLCRKRTERMILGVLI